MIGGYITLDSMSAYFRCLTCAEASRKKIPVSSEILLQICYDCAWCGMSVGTGPMKLVARMIKPGVDSTRHWGNHVAMTDEEWGLIEWWKENHGL